MEPTRTVDGRAEVIAALPRRLRLRAIRSALEAGDPSLAAEMGWLLLDLAALEPVVSHKSFLDKYLRRLLGRNNPRAASHLLAKRLAVLPPEQQDVALSFEGVDWAQVGADQALSGAGPDPQSIHSLALHAARTGRPTVAPALVRGLSETDNSAAQAAESALLLLCIAGCRRLLATVPQAMEALQVAAAFPTLDPGRWHEMTPAEGSALERALSDACVSFDSHRRRGVLIGAILLLDRAASRAKDSPLATWFGRVDHPSHAALRGALRWCRLPVAGLRSWEWLWRDDLGTTALDRLVRAGSVGEHDAVFSRAGLALRPKRARRLGEVDLPRVIPTGEGAARTNRGGPTEQFVPSRGVMPMLSPAARRGVPRVVALLRGAPKARVAVLEPLLTDPDPIVRLALGRALPLRSLGDLCFDADARVARSAFIAWSSAGHLSDARAHAGTHEQQRLLGILARSPHESVRAMAVVESCSTGQAGANSLAARFRVRQRLRRDRDGAMSYLAAQILGGDATLRAQTVMMVRRLDLVARFERELIEVANSGVAGEAASPVARAAASAIAGLGDLSSEASLRALRQCLAARDSRVRANAVEALGRRARRRPMAPGEVPPELAADPHHRVRGNAVRALVSVPTPGVKSAGEGLMRMLSDEREMHRSAGAWAAGCALKATGREHLGEAYPALLARVCEMAKFDDSPSVRRRAYLAATQAQTELRAIVTGGGQDEAPLAQAQEVSA